MSLRSYAHLRVAIGLICFSATGISAVNAAGIETPKAAELAASAILCDAVAVPQLSVQDEIACSISTVRSTLNLSEFAVSDFGDSDDAQK